MSEKENRKAHYAELQKMSLEQKIEWAEFRIKEFLNWLEENKFEECLIAFSGGKDSTVLLELVSRTAKKINSKIKLIPAYAMEITFPETIKFIKETVKKKQELYPNLQKLKLVPPKKSWAEILEKWGYPIFSKQISNSIYKIRNANTKHNLLKYAFGLEYSKMFYMPKERLFLLDRWFTTYNLSNACCEHVKGGLKHDKRPSFVGTCAEESQLRKKSWISHGCNILDKNKAMSRPLSLWNEKDIWNFIKNERLEINEMYGYNAEQHNIDNLLFNRLGCSACPFGTQFEERVKKSNKDYKNRFEKLYEVNQALYQQQVIKTGIYRVLIDMNVKIENDKKYMSLYKLYRGLIENWYKESQKGILSILWQIENNGKNKTNWKWEIEEINKILDFYKEKNITVQEKNELWNEFIDLNEDINAFKKIDKN